MGKIIALVAAVFAGIALGLLVNTAIVALVSWLLSVIFGWGMLNFYQLLGVGALLSVVNLWRVLTS